MRKSTSTIESMAIKLAESGKVNEARLLLDSHLLWQLNKEQQGLKREYEWNNIKRDISSVVWFPFKVVAFIICSPIGCIIRLVEVCKKK